MFLYIYFVVLFSSVILPLYQPRPRHGAGFILLLCWFFFCSSVFLSGVGVGGGALMGCEVQGTPPPPVPLAMMNGGWGKWATQILPFFSII